MKSRILFILAVSLLFLSSSCMSSRYPNDNAILYNTEWSVKKETEGLKFFKDNTVGYYAGSIRGSGTFKYNEAQGIITFDGLIIDASFASKEITHAEMKKNGTRMKLYWHNIGSSKDNYEELYKRR